MVIRMTEKNSLKNCIKGLISFILILSMVLYLPASYATAEAETSKEYSGYVYFTVERITLGQGLVVKPIRVGFYEEDTLADITERVLGNMSTYEGDNSSYFIQGVKDGGAPSEWKADDIPNVIVEAVGGRQTITERNTMNELNNGDYSNNSSWLFSLNNTGIQAGAGSYRYKSDTYSYDNDDVVRLQFSVYGWGQDTNTWDASWGSDPLITLPNKDGLIKLIADFKGNYESKAYINAINVLEKWDASESDITNASKGLSNEIVMEEQELCLAAERSVINYLKTTVINPLVSSSGGEWTVLALARSGVEDSDIYSKYYANVVRTLNGNKSAKLSSTKSTENSRVILALTSIGADPRNINGYNLLLPLAEKDYVVKQGIMGAVYALLAVDSGNYEFPAVSDGSIQTNRAELVNYIMEKKLMDGGWGIIGSTADTDTTALVINALIPYINSNKEVQKAVEVALRLLSDRQCESGGYIGYDIENAESTAQVLCALCNTKAYESSIYSKDDMFIKYGVTPAVRLVDFISNDSGAFSHIVNGNPDQMATEQAAYALVAYKRMVQGESSLFDMSGDKLLPLYDNDKVNSILKSYINVEPTQVTQVKPTEVAPLISVSSTSKPVTLPPTQTQAVPPVDKANNAVKKKFVVNNIVYKIISKKYVECIGQNKKKSKKTILIPASVKYKGLKYKVISVANKAFEKNKKINKVLIGKNVARIGKKAFYGCSNLISIKICSTKVLSIGKNAFASLNKGAVMSVSHKLSNLYKYLDKTIKIKKECD